MIATVLPGFVGVLVVAFLFIFGALFYIAIKFGDDDHDGFA